MDPIDELKEISNRGRVAFAICCLESALDHFQSDKKSWKPVFDELWKFCSSDMAIWQQRCGEAIPFSVCEKIDWKIKDSRYLTKEEHDALQELYDGANVIALDIINLIHDIGTTNINVTIRNEALKMAAIPFIQSLIDLMNTNKIPLPDIKLFKKFPITDNRGWGWTFNREDLFKSE